MKSQTRRTLKRLGITLAGLTLVVSVFTFSRISTNEQIRKAGCFDRIASELEAGADADALFDRDLQNLQTLVEYSLVTRSIALEVANRAAQTPDQPLSSNDLYTLKSGTEAYLDIRADLYQLADAYECATAADQAMLDDYAITPQLRLKALMLSLGAALTLYDNYMLGIVLFEHDDRLRRVVNDPDMGFGLIANKLAEATLAANSVETRHRARQAIEFYEREKNIISDAHEDSDFAYLQQLIESSPSYNYVKKLRVGEIAANKFIAFERLTGDMVSESAEGGLDFISGLFGNTVGLYESRKGKLYRDEAAKKNLQSVLQPLDILLEKTPFRLTDKLIPGHFGHVAIWTGTKAELIELDVWDELLVQQYADQVSNQNDPESKNEKQIIEALRNGVQLSSLDHFLNVDDIAVLRPIFENDVDRQQARQALLLAFRQIGKDYDFNFDVNTTDKIVCSELAYVSFPTLDWPTQKTLGRHSISPDHVAELAWNNLPLKLVMLYHDGELVDESIHVEKMKELMTH